VARYLTVFLGVLAVAALGAAAPAAAASCGGCGVILEHCNANCQGLKAKDEVVTCLMACDNAAAACSCDEPVTLRSEDVVAMGLAAGGQGWLTEACHSTTPCGPAYGSCAGWSAYYDCGDPYCGTYKWCEDPPFCEAPDICFGPATRTDRERYRVCFNASGQPCTEYQRITGSLQGCGC
jgi:hypothetical protein